MRGREVETMRTINPFQKTVLCGGAPPKSGTFAGEHD